MKHIGIYSECRGAGGPSRYIEMLLSGMSRQEFEVTVFCYRDSPLCSVQQVNHVYLDEARPAPISRGADEPVPELPKRTFKHRVWQKTAPSTVKVWAGFSRNVLTLSRLFRAHPVDLLHTNNVGCEESPVAARLAGIPAILGTLHVRPCYHTDHRLNARRYRVLEYISNHCLHHHIAVSDAVKDEWISRSRLNREKITTIYNGVAVQQFSRTTANADARRAFGLSLKDELLVGCVSRLEQEKGVQYLLPTLQLLAEQYPNVHLAVIGDGSLRDEMIAQATDMGLRENVHILGFRSDVETFYSALDIYVAPSLTEAFGFAIIEAMAAGLPVVATRVGGNPEAVAEGETGFLAEPASPSGLAQGLGPLIESEQLRGSMGSAGRVRAAQHFDEPVMVSRTLQMYRDMLRIQPSPCSDGAKCADTEYVH